MIGFSPDGHAALAWGPPVTTAKNDGVDVVCHSYGAGFGIPTAVATGIPDPSEYLQVALSAHGVAGLRTTTQITRLNQA